MITKVTITGADDTVTPKELIALSAEFPFVEWGILVSQKSFGRKRFPSKKWLDELLKEVLPVKLLKQPQFSMHLCGELVESTLNGSWDVNALTVAYPIFDRVQLNTHGEVHEYSKKFPQFLPLGIEYIFQYDGVNPGPLRTALDAGVKCSALFDLSHGAGILPKEWPLPMAGVKCGYAGGLGPENLQEQIRIIKEKARGAQIWIDMETKVRSLNDAAFDLFKVRQCLEIAKPHVTEIENVPS